MEPGREARKSRGRGQQVNRNRGSDCDIKVLTSTQDEWNNEFIAKDPRERSKNPFLPIGKSLLSKFASTAEAY